MVRKPRPRTRPRIGIVERVTVRGKTGWVRILAKIDTGAARTSLDIDLATHLGLGPVIKTVRIRAAAAERPEVRPVVLAHVRIRGLTFSVAAAIADRKDMRYRMIVGMDVLRTSRFLIDPSASVPARARRRNRMVHR